MSEIDEGSIILASGLNRNSSAHNARNFTNNQMSQSRQKSEKKLSIRDNRRLGNDIQDQQVSGNLLNLRLNQLPSQSNENNQQNKVTHFILNHENREGLRKSEMY